jgi:hypothetical protein
MFVETTDKNLKRMEKSEEKSLGLPGRGDDSIRMGWNKMELSGSEQVRLVGL